MCEGWKGLALLALVTGCVPKIGDLSARELAHNTPEQWNLPADGPSSATARWSEYFADPTLVALVDTAVQHNQELGLRLQEANISQAEFLARRGEYLPRLGARAGAGVERVGRFTSQGASDASDDIEPGLKVPENLGDLHYGVQASWEIDVWKRLRNASRAAQLRYLASVEGRNFAITGVVAEVAGTYYELLALDARLRVIDENIEALRSSLEIVRLQKEAARATEMGVQRFEAELLDSQAERQQVLLERAATENRLNTLCGRFPQAIERRAETFTQRPASPARAGTPRELLENRPDIRAAELEVEASKLDVKAARAAFYPALGLDAEVGFEAFTLTRLPTPESLMFGVAGGLVAPLLNRAELKGGYIAANARQTQAVLSYERAVIGAFAEVATQRVRLDHLEQSAKFRNDQVATLRRAFDISTDLFRRARADYLEVLTTRRDVLETEIANIETQLQLLEARVALYAALGGGWRDASTATTEPPRPASRERKEKP